MQNLGSMIFGLHKNKNFDMKNQGMKKCCHPLLQPSSSPYPKHLAILLLVQEAESTGGPKARGASKEGNARAVDEVTVQMLFLWIHPRRELKRKFKT